MANILIVTEAYIKEHTIIPSNVDSKLITPAIKDCQNLYIHKILGSALFYEIASQISGNTVSVLNRTLINDYITPCLMAYVLYEVAPMINYQFTNKNIATKDSESSKPLTLDEIKFIMDRLLNKAEWYGERVINFLKENYEDYPLYKNPGTGCDTIKPANSNYTCGMYLGDDEDCNEYE